jgi:hypothetical protein
MLTLLTSSWRDFLTPWRLKFVSVVHKFNLYRKGNRIPSPLISLLTLSREVISICTLRAECILFKCYSRWYV